MRDSLRHRTELPGKTRSPEAHHRLVLGLVLAVSGHWEIVRLLLINCAALC
jgi:hypothetical protein